CLTIAAGVGVSGGTTSRRGDARSAARSTARSTIPSAIHKIKHVIVIMQENRSFDSYFGTYPRAVGFPAHDGRFTKCVPNPAKHRCDYPYHETALVNYGAKHTPSNSTKDVDGGKMDGFIAAVEGKGNPSRVDVMGYHDAREIPNYWT